MDLCRLCGAEKKPLDLVIALSEEIQIITFKEFVEYYCRIDLDSNIALPQKVCQSCKNSVVKFAEFSYIVDEQQKMFDVKPKIIEIFDEPEAKKIKVDESSNKNEKLDTNTELVTEIVVEKTEIVDEKTDIVEIDTAKTSRLRERRKSVVFQKSIQTLLSNDKTIARNLEEVEKIFSHEPPENSKFYEKIIIAKSKLLPHGEVPKSWLEQFKDFKTWNDLSYKCSQHCEEEFKSLDELLWHHEKSVIIKQRTIQCKICNRKFGGSKYFLCSYVNHVARMHYEHIKYACVVCSKVFFNIPHLLTHYKNVHPDRDLTMFPCLVCGLYCQSVPHLNRHKRSHDPKSDDDVSDVE